MPLTKFVEQPLIREAFKANAVKMRLPFDAKDMEPTVPSCGQHHSAVGTAFDYLARFRIAREVMQNMKDADITLYDVGWAAEEAVSVMADHPKYRKNHARWSFLVAKARELFDAYIEGREDSIERVAKCSQFLANVDLLVRIGDFNPNFQPRDEVQNELLGLNTNFDPLALLRPQRAVLMNPVFMAADLVDGADGDLIVDNTLIDIKTTNVISVSVSHLRQLVGYKVLYDMGGVDAGGGEVYAEPIEEVGIYFSRYGRLVKWRIDEIMPGDGFHRFADVCRAEMEASKRLGPAPR